MDGYVNESGGQQRATFKKYLTLISVSLIPQKIGFWLSLPSMHLMDTDLAHTGTKYSQGQTLAS